MGLIPRLGRYPEGGHGNPLQYSCLENPWTEEPGGTQSMGSHTVEHDSSDLASTHTHKAIIWFPPSVTITFYSILYLAHYIPMTLVFFSVPWILWILSHVRTLAKAFSFAWEALLFSLRIGSHSSSLDFKFHLSENFSLTIPNEHSLVLYSILFVNHCFNNVLFIV